MSEPASSRRLRCIWLTANRPAEALNGKYSTAGGSPISQAHLTATRAHLAQSQYWGIWQFHDMNANPDRHIANLMKVALDTTGQPQVMILGANGKALHAGIVYGWNQSGFLISAVDSFFQVSMANRSRTGIRRLFAGRRISKTRSLSLYGRMTASTRSSVK